MGTKLERKDVKVFASNPNHATQVSAFLTGKNETPDYTSDPNAIQNAYYPKGWFGDGENNLPQGTDMNGVMYAESYKNAYLYEMGIAEWSSTQEYFLNSYCQVNGVLYLSLIDENLNNNPTTDDGTKWQEIALEPYTGENVGTGEGVYKQKTIDNKLQFKTLAVTGNGNISSSGDVVTIAIGGGGTGDVYWGAIDGTLSNQSDLQQALNLKQNAIGYTPEDVANKVTTIRTDTVATDTAYPSELATRTAIDSAITSANNYTDLALQTLNSNAFVLYANSWTDVDTGTLTTTAPTGTGTAVPLTSVGSSYENIATFSYTTTQQTIFNNTFTYDILLPIRNAALKEWNFKIKLTIEHLDVNGGIPTTLVEYETSKFFPPTTQNLNIEIKQDNLNLSSITYPTGSEIKFNIKAKCESNSYDLDLLVYDQTSPLVISRNRSINQNLVTALNTQALGTEQNQEYFNTYINNSLAGKQNTIQDVSFTSNTTQVKQEPDTSKTSFLGTDSQPYNYAYIDQIGDSLTPTTNIYSTNITSTNITTDNYKNNINYTNPQTTFTDFNFGSTYEYSTGVVSNIEMPILNITSCYDNDLNTYTEILPQKTSNPNFKLHNCSLGSSTQRFDAGYFRSLNTSSSVTTPTLYVQSIERSGSGNLTLKNNLIPDSNQELGSSTYPYNKTYSTNIYTNNLNSISGHVYVQSPIRDSGAGVHNIGNNDYYFSGVYAGGFVTRPSDIREKENVENYKNSVLDKLDKLNPMTYTIKGSKDGEVKFGLSAQELQEIEPLCVVGSETKSDEKLGIELYATLTLAMQAIKELNDKVKTLEARIEELEGKKELEK